jgi:hypothetical protein
MDAIAEIVAGLVDDELRDMIAVIDVRIERRGGDLDNARPSSPMWQTITLSFATARAPAATTWSWPW